MLKKEIQSIRKRQSPNYLGYVNWLLIWVQYFPNWTSSNIIQQCNLKLFDSNLLIQS